LQEALGQVALQKSIFFEAREGAILRLATETGIRWKGKPKKIKERSDPAIVMWSEELRKLTCAAPVQVACDPRLTPGSLAAKLPSNFYLYRVAIGVGGEIADCPANRSQTLCSPPLRAQLIGFSSVARARSAVFCSPFN
jgi:hypothetical protein